MRGDIDTQDDKEPHLLQLKVFPLLLEMCELANLSLSWADFTAGETFSDMGKVMRKIAASQYQFCKDTLDKGSVLHIQTLL